MSARAFEAACVASPHHLASAAGADVLRAGGNALDAAIATNLVLGVVTPYLCGYGGDLFAMVWDGERLHAYAGAGRAPAAATRAAVVAALGGSDRMPPFGALSVTVPGAVAGWFDLLERLGTRPLGELAARALAYAREGFEVSDRAARAFATGGQRYRGEAWHAVYGDARAGSVLRQPALARTIETLSDAGPDPYYRGPIAAAIAAAVRGGGGLLEPDDLAEHRGEWVEPLSAPFRDLEVFEMPPPTQGVAALQALGIADGLEWRDAAGREHLLIEAAKLALADRDANLTDPDHMRIAPRALLDEDRLAEHRARIDPARAAELPAGTPARGGTAYLCAADAQGMLVSLIQSNYMGFGSGVAVPEWGINLQNRGSYFSLDPGHVNVVAPRKRTAHTLIPAMAFRGGRPWLVFGSMGGDAQAQIHLQLLERIARGEDLQEAIDAPRWAVSPDGWTVSIESRFPVSVVEALRARGHDVSVVGPYEGLMGHAHAIAPAATGYVAASDPRSEGAALGL